MVFRPSEKFTIYDGFYVPITIIKGTKKEVYALQGDNRGGFYMVPIKNGRFLCKAEDILWAGFAGGNPREIVEGKVKREGARLLSYAEQKEILRNNPNSLKEWTKTYNKEYPESYSNPESMISRVVSYDDMDSSNNDQEIKQFLEEKGKMCPVGDVGMGSYRLERGTLT